MTRPTNFELNKTMIKKSLLTLIVMFASVCGVYAQGFTAISPGSLGLNAGDAVDGIFNLGTQLSQANDSDITLTISNGHVSADGTSWTVAEGDSSVFTLGGVTAASAFVNHGRNLGSNNGTNGSGSRDGLTATAGESWTLDTTTLDSDYTFGSSANDYFVDYTGLETNQVEENSAGFVFRSAQPVTVFTVFSNNTVDLDNNFTIGFQPVTAIPEPAAGAFLALAGMFFVRRKRS